MWIARDDDGDLYLYEEEPISFGYYYYSEGSICTKLNKDLFPELSFEDGPKQVKLVLAK